MIDIVLAKKVAKKLSGFINLQKICQSSEHGRYNL